MTDMAFNRMMNEVDSFSYDQIVALLARLTQVLQSWTIFENEEIPNELTQKVMKDAESGINLSPVFNSTEDFMADLNA